MHCNTTFLFTATVLFIVGCCQVASAQPETWHLLPQSPVAMSRLDDASFIDSKVGWVIDIQGYIYQTTDGGSTWNMLIQDEENLGYRVFFRSIGFANESVGWVGNLGRSSQNPDFRHILHETRDGGITWTDVTDRISGAKPAGLCGLWVVNEQLAYGVGRFGLGPSTFLKTTDSGLNWTSTDMTDIAGVLIDVFFFDENTGLIVGSTAPADDSLDAWEDLDTVNAAIFMTTDGGDTWELKHQSADLNEWGWKISFPTRLTGYVSVQGANRTKVLKTIDGGLTWDAKPIPAGSGGSAMGFIDEQVGWTGGEGTVVSTDGGDSWENAGFGQSLNRIRALGDSVAYAVGDRVYKYQRSLPTAVEGEMPKVFSLDQNYPNPFYPHTTIPYTVPAGTDVKIVIQDALGRQIATLTDRPHEPGRHQIVWDGTDDAGFPVPSGQYFYRLTMGNFVETKAMTLQR